jgi:hypothetical protein
VKQCRLIGNAKPAIWESGEPAHHRMSPHTAYFYRRNVNSIIKVSPKVTRDFVSFHDSSLAESFSPYSILTPAEGYESGTDPIRRELTDFYGAHVPCREALEF